MILNGSFVIGKINQEHIGWGHLFGGVDDYVIYDNTYEIFFENGILTDMTDISAANQEYIQLEKSHKYNQRKLREMKPKIAVKYLKGCYYEAPYYSRESNYSDGDEISIWNDPFDLLTKE